MSRHDEVAPDPNSGPFTNPWPFLIAGLAIIVVALLLRLLTGSAGMPAQFALIVAGLIAVGAAISIRLQTASWELQERLRSAGLLAAGALTAFLANLAMDASWDTAKLLLAVLVGLALAGTVIVLLPQTLRRLALSLLLLYHFGGIVIAATSVAPPSGISPWLTIQIWTRLYRPYLYFLYMNNAYHFYSPEPGPPVELWFYIKYEDGSDRWIKIPGREQHHTRLEYQRMLALTESANMGQPTPANFELRWQQRLLGRVRPGGQFENVRDEWRTRPEVVWKQLSMGDYLTVLVIPPSPSNAIPSIPPTLQFREPTPYSKKTIASYARHVARYHPNEMNPDSKVRSVKVYRVTHRMLVPSEFVEGKDPFDGPTYQPHYQGEFDPDGNLMDPNDPFLYWLIPIVEVPRNPQPQGLRVVLPQRTQDKVMIDYLTLHATTISTPAPSRQPPEEP